MSYERGVDVVILAGIGAGSGWNGVALSDSAHPPAGAFPLVLLPGGRGRRRKIGRRLEEARADPDRGALRAAFDAQGAPVPPARARRRGVPAHREGQNPVPMRRMRALEKLERVREGKGGSRLRLAPMIGLAVGRIMRPLTGWKWESRLLLEPMIQTGLAAAACCN